MLKFLFFVILLAAAGLVACSDPTPVPTSTTAPTSTPVPTATTVPTSTPVPTATAAPTNTPVPTPAEAPTNDPEPEPAESASDQAEKPVSGGITPLKMDDPEAIASELSVSELACLAATADVDRLLKLLASPEQATQEEQGQLIGCLGEETLLRIFLTGLIGEVGPLSEESSACIRTSFEGIDLQSLMMAGTTGDEQAAMIGSMSGFFMTIACLNEEEWAVAAPALGMNADDQEGMQCLMVTMGGAEGLADALGTGDGTGIMAVFGAAMGCGLEIDGTAPGG